MMKRTFVIALVLSLTAPMLFAQGIGFGPQVGYYKARDADEGDLMIGGVLRLKFSEALAIEGSINYREEKYRDGLITAKSWPIMATALFYPLPVLYGAAGAGWYNTTIEYDHERLGLRRSEAEDTTQEFGWHFGGGIELPFSGSKLYGDIRYVFLDYKFEAVPGSRDIESDFYVITVGLLWGL